MLPLLPFAAGLLAGAAVIKLWRNEKAQAGIDSAREKLREATVAGLSRLESSTARARSRLTTAEEAVAPNAGKTRSRKPAAAKPAASEPAAAKPAAGKPASAKPKAAKAASATPRRSKAVSDSTASGDGA